MKILGQLQIIYQKTLPVIMNKNNFTCQMKFLTITTLFIKINSYKEIAGQNDIYYILLFYRGMRLILLQNLKKDTTRKHGKLLEKFIDKSGKEIIHFWEPQF